MNKHKIGVLEMSKEASKLYYNLLSKHDSFLNTDIVIYHTNFKEINHLLPYPSKELKQILLSYLLNIKDIQHLIVPNITIHQTLDELFTEHPFKFSLVHPILEIAKKLKSENRKQVVIFGTKFTMKSGYISNLLENEHIICSFPNTEDLKTIEACRIAVYNKEATQELETNFNKIILKYTSKTTVVLACTELSMIYNSNNSNVLDLVKIQIDSCFNK